jgi:hypothetical protein
MQESYGEGVAIHTDPELCVTSRKAGCEALVGARAGRALSPESTLTGMPTQSPWVEGHTLAIESARWLGIPRGLRPRACTETPRTRTGRSQISPGGLLYAGSLERSGKSEDARR